MTDAAATICTIAMLEKLVAFDTVSRNSNLAFIEFVGGLLKDHGVESRLVYNEDRTKANLLATIGPNIPGGIVLSGHTGCRARRRPGLAYQPVQRR